ncbi:MAG: right-handed parallel beta-helix repeat-containing protein [Victivallales bacterium]|nr:right-handed parallel beta-helix repeat-containing protein [Victivallales bacterium]
MKKHKQQTSKFEKMSLFFGLNNFLRLKFNKLFISMTGVFLAASTLGAELNVRDFGATGDGKTDDTKAFNRAVSALKTSEPGSILKLPAGSYFFSGTGKINNGNLVIERLEKQTIEGEGVNTVLLFGNPQHKGLRALHCRKSTFRNFTIRYLPPLAIQGTVSSAGASELTLKLDSADKEPLMFSPLHIIFFRPDGTYEHKIPRNRVKSMEQLPDGQYRIITEWPFGAIVTPGLSAVIFYRFNNSTAFNNEFSNDCTIENVTINNGPSAAFSATNCSGMKFIACRVVPEKGRLLSTAADGVHVKNNRRGPQIIDCIFRNMCDDGINISTMAAPVYSVNGKVMVIDSNLPYEKGDKLTIYDGRDLKEYTSVSVAALRRIDRKGKRVWEVTAEDTLPEIPRTLEITGKEFDRKNLPALALNLSIAGAGSRIVNCEFADHRARGILLRAPAIIENCRFRNLRGPAILLGPEIFWLESGDLSDITIQNNRFDDIGLTNIQVEAFGADHRPQAVSGKIIRNLVIRNNIFNNYGIPSPENSGYGVHGRIINVTNGENILISGNTFGRPHPVAVPTAAITTPGSKNVTIENNNMEMDK